MGTGITRTGLRPTRRLIDAVKSDNPVFINRLDDHMFKVIPSPSEGVMAGAICDALTYIVCFALIRFVR
jgi:hypothetical protein